MTRDALSLRDDPPPNGILAHLGVDGCVRLPLRVDAHPLAAEIHRLPDAIWRQTERDPVVLAAVESFFVIGHPRGARPMPPEDREVLNLLPDLRRLLHETIPASPTRAIVARLLPDGFIPIHTDTPRHFRGTLRLSVQLEADGIQRLYCDGLWYSMTVGEVWGVDNLKPHAIRNTGTRPRLNVLADYLPSEDLLRWVTEGDRGLGVTDPAAHLEIDALSRHHYRKNRWRAAGYELSKVLRRSWPARGRSGA